MGNFRQRLVFISTRLGTGGAELALERYIRQLLPAGEFEISVCSLMEPVPSPLLDRLRELGSPVYTVGMSTMNWPFALLRLARWLRRNNPQIVCSMMYHPNVLCRILRPMLRFPVLLSFERTMGQEGAVRRWLNRLTVPLADKVVAVAPAVADEAKKRLALPASKIAVVTNGVDVRRFHHLEPRNSAKSRLGCKPNDFVVVCVANFRHIKGHRYLIKAFAAAHHSLPNARLLLIGEGPLRPAIAADIESTGLANEIRLLGQTEQIEMVLAAADLSVLPSLTEGMSNSLLEAMAAGLPVIATAVGGNRDLIENGVCGILVPPRDSGALAAAISRLARDPELRGHLGSAARIKVQQDYSIEAVGAALRDLLISCRGEG